MVGLAAVLAAVVGSNVWTGCTVTPSNYRTLSLFFDGVPDPSKTNVLVDPKTGQAMAGMMQSVHKPFFEQACGECHRARVRLSKNDSTLCSKCHAGKEREHEHMHGPVAAMACLWCHIPHESKQAHLLRDEPRALCTQCHLPDVLDAGRVPEHADKDRSCLECHFGHGGPRAFMLRDTLPAGKEGK